jgi:hypothetical protein
MEYAHFKSVSANLTKRLAFADRKSPSCAWRLLRAAPTEVSMPATFRVHITRAAAVLIGQQKQAIIEDAVGKVESLPNQKEAVVILQVNHLPVRLVIQVADRIIDIMTNEEADKCGVMKSPGASAARN